MNLVINGDHMEVPGTISTISDLLHHFGLDNKVVMIELNTKIIDKAFHAETRLSDGMRVEIVHFVGGG